MLIGATLLLLIVVPATAAKQPWIEGSCLDFRLPDLQGRPVSSSDERFVGKVILVNLWATWCPPCISEIPTLIELQRKYHDRGLIIVAIAFELEKQPELRRHKLHEFGEEHGINYLVLDGGLPQDFESALPTARNVKGFPVEILVNRTGLVTKAKNSYGFKKSWARKLNRDVDSLLCNHEN